MKKVFGIVFIGLGVLFTPITAVGLLQFAGKIFSVMKKSSIERFENLFGGLIAVALLVFLTVSFYRLGYKWVKGKPKVEETNNNNIH